MKGAMGRGGSHRVTDAVVKQPVRRLAWLFCIGAVALLNGCATPEAVAPTGKWRPLNHYTAVPQAIPLQQAYVFQALPVDGTLKGMLTRWAKDAGVSLVYQHPNDYTLHTQAASIRAASLAEGADALNAAYAAQGVSVAVQGSRLLVSPSAAAGPGAPAETGKGN